MSNFSKLPKSLRKRVFSGAEVPGHWLPRQGVPLESGCWKSETKDGAFLFELVFCLKKHDILGAAAKWRMVRPAAGGLADGRDGRVCLRGFMKVNAEIQERCSRQAGAAKRAAQGLPPC